MDDYMLFDQAIELRSQGKLNKCIIILKTLADKYDEDGVINYELAHTLHQNKQYYNSVKYFERALDDELTRETELIAYQKFSLSLIYSKEYRRSSEILFKAIQKFPEELIFQILYGVVQQFSGNSDSAAKIFLEIISKTEDPRLLEYKEILSNLSDRV